MNDNTNTSYKPDAKGEAFLARMVDELAATNARIAELKTLADGIKAALISTERKHIDGKLHAVTISHQEGRTLVDWAAVAAKFSPSRQLIAAHTTQGEPFVTVRVYGRKQS